MNLYSITNNYNKNEVVKNPLSEINTSDPIFIFHNKMNNSDIATYNVNLIYLLDRLFVNDYYTALSKEQERFIKLFLYEAGIVTDNLNKNSDNSYENMSDIMLQLDNFLGNYLGENNGQFTR